MHGSRKLPTPTAVCQLPAARNTTVEATAALRGLQVQCNCMLPIRDFEGAHDGGGNSRHNFWKHLGGRGAAVVGGRVGRTGDGSGLSRPLYVEAGRVSLVVSGA